MIYLVSNQIFGGTDIKKSSFEEFYTLFDLCEEVEVDTETEGFDPHTKKCLTIQIGNSEDQFIFDCLSVDVTKLAPFFSKKERVFLFHNAKFDLKFLKKLGLFPTNIYDTFLAENVLYCGVKSVKTSLDAVTQRYLGVTLNKSIRGDINKFGLTTKVIEYAAADVRYLGEIKKRQLEKIEKYKLQNILDLEHEVVKVFAVMEYNGVAIDLNKWEEILKEIVRNVNQLESELDSITLSESKLSKYKPKYIQGNLFGFEERILNINWASAKQKLQILRDLGLKVDSTEEKVLLGLVTKHLLIPKLIEYNKVGKLKSSFGKSFTKSVNSTTGRIHPEIWQILSTGRISVKNPNVNTIPSGGNLGKQIRSCFVPKKGYKMVGGDYSGMELRILAEISQDPLWVKAFRESQDLHSILCSKTFDIPIEDVKTPFPLKPEKSYRDIQKIINFGLCYGMSEFKLANTLQIDVIEAKKIIDKFFSQVPKVQETLEGFSTIGVKYGRIRTMQPYGRLRFFTDQKEKIESNFSFKKKIDGEISRASKNLPVQGTNADIIKLALVNTHKLIEDNDYPVNIVLSVYDEIQTECEETFTKEWRGMLEDVMKTSAEMVVKTVPIEVDCSINDYWQK